MADSTFILHNRVGANDGASDMTKLEESALDRESQLEGVLAQLKKMVLHLQSITDEEILEE